MNFLSSSILLTDPPITCLSKNLLNPEGVASNVLSPNVLTILSKSSSNLFVSIN